MLLLSGSKTHEVIFQSQKTGKSWASWSALLKNQHPSPCEDQIHDPRIMSPELD